MVDDSDGDSFGSLECFDMREDESISLNNEGKENVKSRRQAEIEEIAA